MSSLSLSSDQPKDTENEFEFSILLDETQEDKPLLFPLLDGHTSTLLEASGIIMDDDGKASPDKTESWLLVL